MLKNRQLQVLKIEKIKGLALARCMSRHSGVRGRGSRATSARHSAARARAGYLVRSIKVSTACITEVCGLRKQ